MLQAIRDRASGVIAWIIVILLIIPFALWGIHSYFGNGGEVVVAKVNGTDISKQAYSDAVRRVMDRMGSSLDDAGQARMRKAVLENMIAEEAQTQAAHDLGMRVSDGFLGALIRSAPDFQRNGKFDEALYARMLQSQGMTPQEFLQDLRRRALVGQLQSSVVATEFVTKQELDEFIRLRDRKLKLSYAVLTVADFLSKVSVTDKQVSDYYDQHHDEFVAPERVKLAYLEVSLKQLKDSIKISDEQLRKQYEQHKASYSVPAQRSAAHILIAVPRDADAAKVEAAKKKAEAIYKQLQDGASFAELAKKDSDDAGSAAEGGNLGVVRQGTFDAQFVKALYGINKVGDITAPVRTPFGFHIIKLTALTPGHQKSFEEARADIEDEMRNQQAENEYYDRSQRLSDQATDNPLSLEPAAKELGLKIQETDWIPRTGTDKGIGAFPDVVKAAFSDDVLAGGKLSDALNSTLIELRKRGDRQSVPPALVLRVKAYQPAELQSLDAVKATIEAKLRHQAAEKQVRQAADALLKQARAGASLSDLVAARKLKLVDAGEVSRNDSAHEPAIVSAAFGLPKPATAKIEFGTAELPDGDYALMAVSDVKDGDPAKTPDAQRKMYRQLLARAMGGQAYESLAGAVRKAAEVKIIDKNLGITQ